MKIGVFLTCVAIALPGCAGQDLSRYLYEGIQLYNQSQRGTPREGPLGPAPTYDQYERERRADATPRSP